jgi:hypothetical protein
MSANVTAATGAPKSVLKQVDNRVRIDSESSDQMTWVSPQIVCYATSSVTNQLPGVATLGRMDWVHPTPPFKRR